MKQDISNHVEMLKRTGKMKNATGCCFVLMLFVGLLPCFFVVVAFVMVNYFYFLFLFFCISRRGRRGLFKFWTPFKCGISEHWKLCNQSAVIMSLYQYVTAWRNFIFTHPGFYGKSLMMLIGFMTDTDGEFRCPNLSL